VVFDFDIREYLCLILRSYLPGWASVVVVETIHGLFQVAEVYYPRLDEVPRFVHSLAMNKIVYMRLPPRGARRMEPREPRHRSRRLADRRVRNHSNL
jgi:hypothetical protein